MPDSDEPLARIFVGSAGESQDMAVQVAVRMMEQAKRRGVTIEAESWTETFQSSDITYDSLLKSVQEHEFGVFIFTADDNATIGGKDTRVTRDNVVFEFGLWAGAYGRDHAHILMPEVMPEDVQVRLLTDLKGLVVQSFDAADEQSLKFAAGEVLKKIIAVAMKEEAQASQAPERQTGHVADSRLLRQLEARLHAGALVEGSPGSLKPGMLVISAIYGLGEVISADDKLVRVNFYDGGARALLHGEVFLPAL